MLLLTVAFLVLAVLAQQLYFSLRVKAASSTIVISEVDADPPLAGTDTANEWFELQNVSLGNITLSNWTIIDNGGSSDIIPTVTIGPGGHVIVAATAAGFASEHPGFTGTVLAIGDGAIGNGLANGGDALLLRDSSAALIDGLSWGSNTTVLNPSAGIDSSANTNQRNVAGTDTDMAADWTRVNETPNGNVWATPSPSPTPPSVVVISQLYGAGGNSGAKHKNDFVEIFNRSNTPVSLAGWSVQIASAAGTLWSPTALSGALAPGQYYLVQLAAGTSGGTTDLPAPDAIGGTNMAVANGKVALVSSTTPLTGGCPLGTPQLMDLVGYGMANCFEGAAAAPALDNNVTANFRTQQGCKDTDSNGGNFAVGSPSPRNTAASLNVCPPGDFRPEIFGTIPAAREAHVSRGTNITINFDEPVNVSGNWFLISCASTGLHTATVSGGPVSFILNPDTGLMFNETCMVTIFASQVTDQDLNDPPDNMAADYAFTFNSEFFRDPAEHMVMGNPSNAIADQSIRTNFLMMKTQYALSYNDSRGAPNWTSWHLDSTWRGNTSRQEDFREDTSLPSGYNQVKETGFDGSGFQRGHMCPSADRTSTIADNSATFLMSNMIAQAEDNNEGPWADFEDYLRTLLPGSEIYIISGGAGTGGTGSNGPANTIAGGLVNVPAVTWKVALVLPVGDNDLSRVDTNTRTIAVIMPNTQGIRSDRWQKYLKTVNEVEAQSGYDFYSKVSTAVQEVIEAKLDPGILQFSAATYTKGENTGSATITVTRTGGGTGAASVDFATANGTATGGDSCAASVDYVSKSGKLSWADGQVGSKTFTVTICDDSANENDEVVSLALSNPTGSALGIFTAATLTIVNDDAPVLLIEENTEHAVALDSVTQTRDPFSLTNPFNLSMDHRRRVSLFVWHLGLLTSDTASALTVLAEDDQGCDYQLMVEYVGAVTDLSDVTQVVVKLPDTVVGAPRDLWVKVSLRGPASGRALIKIAAP